MKNIRTPTAIGCLFYRTILKKKLKTYFLKNFGTTKKRLNLLTMQLSIYISDLLYRYECVILPGFGAFLTQNKSAHVDVVTHTFYPPGKTVSFNRHLQTNDGLLANHIAKSENITYESALFKLREEIKSLKSNLETAELVMIPNIGSLRVENSYVEFLPENTSNFLTEAFGLSSFVSSKMASSTETKVADEPVVSYSPPTSNISYLKYASIGLLALGLTSLGGLYTYNTQVNQHNIVEKQNANALIENQIQQASFLMNTPLPSLTVELKNPAVGNFHIIAGAFRMEENALTKIEQLKEKGYPARTIGVNRHGLYQVVYNSFDTREEANIELSLVKRSENVDAWLLVQELD